jgi:hypothetical protein
VEAGSCGPKVHPGVWTQLGGVPSNSISPTDSDPVVGGRIGSAPLRGIWSEVGLGRGGDGDLEL